MKKRLIYSVIAGIILAASAFGVWWKFFRSSAENAAVRTFIVGFDANFPPYGYMENGEYRGFDIDLAREVARRNGWELVLKPINWDAKDVELNSGMIDCIWNGFTINGREHAYTWSDPYVANEQVVMVPVNSPVQTLRDLHGKVVAVQTDTPVQKALSKDGKRFDDLGAQLKGLIITPDYPTAVMMMEAGSVDAVAMDEGVAAEQMKNAPGKFRVLAEAVMPEYYGIGFRKGDTALRDAVQNTLLEMVADGTAETISARYFDGENRMILGTVQLDIQEDSGKAGVSVWNVAGQLLKGLQVSVMIFFLTLLFSLPLGMLVLVWVRSTTISLPRRPWWLPACWWTGRNVLLQSRMPALRRTARNRWCAASTTSCSCLRIVIWLFFGTQRRWLPSAAPTVLTILCSVPSWRHPWPGFAPMGLPRNLLRSPCWCGPWRGRNLRNFWLCFRSCFKNFCIFGELQQPHAIYEGEMHHVQL